ncbi:MAG: ABC transporter permease [Firmicutes bacterium]|nr:ABC transporter permease [Bacillota bacterium]
MNRKNTSMAYPYSLWLVVFTIIPMLIVIFYAFTDGDGNFTIENFTGMSAYAVVFWRSFKLAIISTVICLLIGYPMAYAMSKLSKRGQTIAMMLVMIPMWMNFLLRTYAWLTILENTGLLNTFLEYLNLPTLSIINTPVAVGLGMVYNYLPFMILPIYTTFTKTDKSLIEAANDLGATGMQVFTKVIFPLSIPGVVSGIVMVFVPAVSTFVISKILGGGANMLVGDLIELQFFGGTYNVNMGAAISLVMMIIIMVFTWLTGKLDSDDGEGSVLLA